MGNLSSHYISVGSYCRVTTIGPRCLRLLYLYFILRCSTGACIIRCSFISVCVRRAHLIFYSKLRCEHNHLYLLLCCLLTSYVVLLIGIATTEYIDLLLEAEISTYRVLPANLYRLSSPDRPCPTLLLPRTRSPRLSSLNSVTTDPIGLTTNQGRKMPWGLRV